MKNRAVRAIAALLAVSCLFTACSSNNTDEDKTITIGTLAWEESLAVTAVWKQVLEEEGYTVKVKQLDPGPAYQALAAGQIDVFPEQWPNYFRDYIEKYEGKIEKLGTWYEGTDINLAVPDYVSDVTSISDLAANPSKFDHRIVGIEAGSETMRVLEEDVVPHYGLGDFNVETSSTPAMLASLEDAINNEQPIVVTLWRPHWAFAKYPIRALEDPDEEFGGTGVIETVANPELGDRAPEAVDILRNFALTSEELGELELAIQDADNDADAGAEAWIEKNRDVVDSWTSD
jgi:glycine betaine/proline transport system substrate-binding protein